MEEEEDPSNVTGSHRAQRERKVPISYDIISENTPTRKRKVVSTPKPKPVRQVKPKPIELKKTVAAKPLTGKQKIEDDAEEQFILEHGEDSSVNRSARTRFSSHVPDSISTVKDAIKYCVKQAPSVILDWTTPQARRIGKPCKVFWEGDEMWYYATILYYDQINDKYFIYYQSDDTAEWIDFKTEIVLVGLEFSLVKYSKTSSVFYPCTVFVGNAVASEISKTVSGYKRGAVFVEFVQDSQYMFANMEDLFDLDDRPDATAAAIRKYPKLKVALASSQAIVDDVLEAIRDRMFDVLKPKEWIGVRVRTSAHVVPQSLESSSKISSGCEVRCAGTVLNYCAVTGLHYVVFDEPLLCPTWTACSRQNFDVLIGDKEFACPRIAPLLGRFGRVTQTTSRQDFVELQSVSSSDIGDNDACYLCGLSGAVACSSASIAAFDGKINRAFTVESVRNMPDAADDLLVPSTQSQLLRCNECRRGFHSYCYPEIESNDFERKRVPVARRVQVIGGIDPSTFVCWNCIQCRGCCGSTQWDRLLMPFSLKRVDPVTASQDEPKLTCGPCLKQYKHVRSFCPICFQLYPMASEEAEEPDPDPVEPSRKQSKKNKKKGGTNSKSTSEVEIIHGIGPAFFHKAGYYSNETAPFGGPLKIPQLIASWNREYHVELDSVAVAPSKKPGRKPVEPVKTAHEHLHSSDSYKSIVALEQNQPAQSEIDPPLDFDVEHCMVFCNECGRWVHAKCEGIDQSQFDAIAEGRHPVWGQEYLCPSCRVDISSRMLEILEEEDKLGIFSEPVTESVAKNYFDVIHNPMDLSTMQYKASRGQYKSLQSLRQDVELMCMNAVVFNKKGDEYWTEAVRYCDAVEKIFSLLPRSTQPTRFGVEMKELIGSNSAAPKGKAVEVVSKKAKKSDSTASIATSSSSSLDRLYEYDGYVPKPSSRRRSSVSATSEEGSSRFGTNSGAGETKATKSASLKAQQGSLESESSPLTSDSIPAEILSPSSASNAPSNAVSLAPAIALAGLLDQSAVLETEESRAQKQAAEGGFLLRLPNQLVAPPDPTNFFNCFAVEIPQQDVAAACSTDWCLICGSTGAEEYFLFCMDCGEAFHSFCVAAPLATMPRERILTWRCTNCKVCEICGSDSDIESNRLVFCENCDRSFHSNCVHPRITASAAAEVQWFCGSCCRCEHCIKPELTGHLDMSTSSTNNAEAGRCWGNSVNECVRCSDNRKRLDELSRLEKVVPPLQSLVPNAGIVGSASSSQIPLPMQQSVDATSNGHNYSIPTSASVKVKGSKSNPVPSSALLKVIDDVNSKIQDSSEMQGMQATGLACYICESAVNPNVLKCSICLRGVHKDCCQGISSFPVPWLPISWSQFRCPTCREPSSSSAAEADSTSGGLWDDNSIIHEYTQRQIFVKNLALFENSMQSRWKTQVSYLQMIIGMAVNRCLRTCQYIVDNQLVGGKLPQKPPPGLPPIQLSRAHRFLRLIWRRRVNESKEEVVARVNRLLHQQSSNGLQLDIHMIVLLAAMSVAFIVATNIHVGDKYIRTEVIDMYQSLIKRERAELGIVPGQDSSVGDSSVTSFEVFKKELDRAMFAVSKIPGPPGIFSMPAAVPVTVSGPPNPNSLRPPERVQAPVNYVVNHPSPAVHVPPKSINGNQHVTAGTMVPPGSIACVPAARPLPSPIQPVPCSQPVIVDATAVAARVTIPSYINGAVPSTHLPPVSTSSHQPVMIGITAGSSGVAMPSYPNRATASAPVTPVSMSSQPIAAAAATDRQGNKELPGQTAIGTSNQISSKRSLHDVQSKGFADISIEMPEREGPKLRLLNHAGLTEVKKARLEALFAPPKLPKSQSSSHPIVSTPRTVEIPSAAKVIPVSKAAQSFTEDSTIQKRRRGRQPKIPVQETKEKDVDEVHFAKLVSIDLCPFSEPSEIGYYRNLMNSQRYQNSEVLQQRPSQRSLFIQHEMVGRLRRSICEEMVALTALEKMILEKDMSLDSQNDQLVIAQGNDDAAKVKSEETEATCNQNSGLVAMDTNASSATPLAAINTSIGGSSGGGDQGNTVSPLLDLAVMQGFVPLNLNKIIVRNQTFNEIMLDPNLIKSGLTIESDYNIETSSVEIRVQVDRSSVGASHNFIVSIPDIRESSYRGVLSQPGSLRWVAVLPRETLFAIGCYNSEQEAAIAHDDQLRSLHARNPSTNYLQYLNFPRGDMSIRNPKPVRVNNLYSLPYFRPSSFSGVRAQGNDWVAYCRYIDPKGESSGKTINSSDLQSQEKLKSELIIGYFQSEFEAAVAAERFMTYHEERSRQSSKLETQPPTLKRPSVPMICEGLLRSIGKSPGIRVKNMQNRSQSQNQAISPDIDPENANAVPSESLPATALDTKSASGGSASSIQILSSSGPNLTRDVAESKPICEIVAENTPIKPLINLPSPLRGWKTKRELPIQRDDSLRCCFCNETASDQAEGHSFFTTTSPLAYCQPVGRTQRFVNCFQPRIVGGRMLALSNSLSAHVNCLRWSSEVVEKNGVLLHAQQATNRRHQICTNCGLPGATVGCFTSRCKKTYHLHCALATCCSLFEVKLNSDPIAQAHEIRTIVSCPLHVDRLDKSSYRHLWRPHDPSRSLVPDDADASSSEDLAKILTIARSSDRAFRSGACTILSLGTLHYETKHFHTATHIFPLHFRSSRIFWSMTAARARSLYLFEVLSDAELSKVLGVDIHRIFNDQDGNHGLSGYQSVFDSKYSFPSSLVLSTRDLMLGSSDALHPGLPNSPEGSQTIDYARLKPVFRVMVSDYPATMLLFPTIDRAFAAIMGGVNSCAAKAGISTIRSKSLTQRTAAQFFGLGIPFVKSAIEMRPESVAYTLTAPPLPQYRPSYFMPNSESVRRMHAAIAANKEKNKVSRSGASRSEPYVPRVASANATGTYRFSKILTKIAGTERKAEKEKERKVDDKDCDDDNGLSQREAERNKYAYEILSREYLEDPNRKLQVRRSAIHGWGLFAKVDFSRNDMVVEYIGERIRQVVADRREADYEAEGVGSCYLFRLDKEVIVDATRRGGMARFMNHCCEPNAYARVISAGDQPGDKHIIIFANRKIEAGEEITYDYKFPIEDKKLKCYCGAPRCSGSMN